MGLFETFYLWEQVAPGCTVGRESVIKHPCWAAAECSCSEVDPGSQEGPVAAGQPGCAQAGLRLLGQCPEVLSPAWQCCHALHRPLYVTVVYQGKCSHCMRIGVAVPISGTVARLRQAVSLETKIPTEQVRAGLLTCVPSLPWEGEGRLLSLVG